MGYIKYLIIFLGIFAAFSKLNAQSIDCAKFKQGTFKMTLNGKSITIKRDATTQLEYDDNSKTSISYLVKWLDNCSYTLRPNASSRIKYAQIPKNALITVKILNVSSNSYKIRATSNFSTLIVTGEVFKIKL